MSTTINNARLTELLGGTLIQGDPAGIITGMNSINEAVPGEVTFLGNPRYFVALRSTKATTVLVGPDFNETLENKALIRVTNPTLAFSSVIQHFRPALRPIIHGVHPSAIVAASAIFDPEKVSIGPNVVLDDGVIIGDGTIIHAGAYIGHSAKIGIDCVIHTNVSVKDRCQLGNRVIIHSSSAIGTDGFGYEFAQGRHLKIEQVGIVQIDDDVEIGSCTTVDRARFGRTWIGEGCKIDNLVQIGHNVVLGKHCIIVALVALAGSTRFGDYVTIAGQVGVGGHLEIASKVTLLARTGVTKSIIEPGTYIGFPAKPAMEGQRLAAAPAKIPDMLARLKALEKRLAALESQSNCP